MSGTTTRARRLLFGQRTRAKIGDAGNRRSRGRRTAACWTMSRMVMVSCASARGYALGLTSDIFLELRESGGGAEGQQSSVPGIESEKRRVSGRG